ncbi:DUF5302 domain-containing protein [Mycetocola spongiae]|uniref:DUF5302 domain-containing protein n=1 Tax=Mycetocola spongiae TaxID=2859226 RepID=UPI001CF0F5C9|nr:DUF5302 domain-containing protein [Mycetocola spongiae]UCR88839.1 DUF5302 domain-containing protein [Mycetocola spongiae]
MSSEEDAQKAAAEESKRKFREALDRKKARTQGKGQDHMDASGAVQHTQGKASQQREFRRKSG